MAWVETARNGVWVQEGMRFPKVYTEEDKKQYFYLCFLEDRNTGTVWLKCGVTCNIEARMTAHQRRYGIVRLFWISPVFSKYTAGKVEDEFKDFGKNHLNWEWVRQDRFILPDEVVEVEVRVRKTYTIPVYR